MPRRGLCDWIRRENGRRRTDPQRLQEIGDASEPFRLYPPSQNIPCRQRSRYSRRHPTTHAYKYLPHPLSRAPSPSPPSSSLFRPASLSALPPSFSTQQAVTSGAMVNWQSPEELATDSGRFPYAYIQFCNIDASRRVRCFHKAHARLAGSLCVSLGQTCPFAPQKS